MNIIGNLVMLGWIPAVFYLFTQFPTQRALVVAFIAAWLFLPLGEFPLPGLPDYTKMSATCYGIMLATAVYDFERFNSFKFGWLDVPMLVWCLCPFVSSLANDLGPYDGLSAALDQTVTWGLPYFLGRIYLNNLKGMRELAIGMMIGGLVYVPLCLAETRLGPQLHQWIYGFNQTVNWALVLRYGGYRPTVFMETGLMVGMWMMAATLIAIWLWHTKAIRDIWGYPASWLVGLLVVTVVLVKSTGAYFYLLIGVLFLFAGQYLGTAVPVFLLMFGMCYYVYNGVTGNISSKDIVPIITQATNAERAQSFEFRLDNEEMLSKKAREKIIFGWGGWGRSRVYDETGKDISVTDSLWIIAFGENGLVGLVSLTASMLLPVGSLFILRYPPRLWAHPKVAPVVAVAMVLMLFMMDCILNAMLNPVFTLSSGGIAGLVLKEPEPRQRPRRALAPQK